MSFTGPEMAYREYEDRLNALRATVAALTAENAALRGELSQVSNRVSPAAIPCSCPEFCLYHAREVFDRQRSELKSVLQDNHTLTATVAELREERDLLLGEIHNCPKCGLNCKQCQCAERVIEPFANSSYLFAESFPDDCIVYRDADCDEPLFNLGDLRRAAAFLASLREVRSGEGRGKEVGT